MKARSRIQAETQANRLLPKNQMKYKPERRAASEDTNYSPWPLHSAAEGLVRLLFRLGCRSLFAGGGNNVLDPHVCDKIAVVFHIVHVVNVQHPEFGYVRAE